MIGVDEAGRGSWAGPLVATACWIDFSNHKLLHSDINDSKKLKSKKRKEIIPTEVENDNRRKIGCCNNECMIL